MTIKTFLPWILRIIPAGILLQTLYFKFTGSTESVALFTALGVEPWGRITVGIIELIVAVLLVIPKTSSVGAVLGAMVMIGAIASHVLVLEISSGGDGGLLFGLACVVLAACVITAYQGRAGLVALVSKLLP